MDNVIYRLIILLESMDSNAVNGTYGVGALSVNMMPVICHLAKNGRRGQNHFWQLNDHEVISHVSNRLKYRYFISIFKFMH